LTIEYKGYFSGMAEKPNSFLQMREIFWKANDGQPLPLIGFNCLSCRNNEFLCEQ